MYRPKRVSAQRAAAYILQEQTSVLFWNEERDLKKALQASLIEARRKARSSSKKPDENDKLQNSDNSKMVNDKSNKSKSRCSSDNRSYSSRSATGTSPSTFKQLNRKTNKLVRSEQCNEDLSVHNGDIDTNSEQSEKTKKTRIPAQRKFAQGTSSVPNTPISTPVKEPCYSMSQNIAKELFTRFKPSAEDFLTFICYRGSGLFPEHLDFEALNKDPPVTSTNTIKHNSEGVKVDSDVSSLNEKENQGENSITPVLPDVLTDDAATVDSIKSDEVIASTTASQEQNFESTKSYSSQDRMLALREKYKLQRLANELSKVNKSSNSRLGLNLSTTAKRSHDPVRKFFKNRNSTVTEAAKRRFVQDAIRSRSMSHHSEAKSQTPKKPTATSLPLIVQSQVQHETFSSNTQMADKKETCTVKSSKESHSESKPKTPSTQRVLRSAQTITSSIQPSPLPSNTTTSTSSSSVSCTKVDESKSLCKLSLRSRDIVNITETRPTNNCSLSRSHDRKAKPVGLVDYHIEIVGESDNDISDNKTESRTHQNPKRILKRDSRSISDDRKRSKPLLKRHSLEEFKTFTTTNTTTNTTTATSQRRVLRSGHFFEDITIEKSPKSLSYVSKPGKRLRSSSVISSVSSSSIATTESSTNKKVLENKYGTKRLSRKAKPVAPLIDYHFELDSDYEYDYHVDDEMHGSKSDTSYSSNKRHHTEKPSKRGPSTSINQLVSESLDKATDRKDSDSLKVNSAKKAKISSDTRKFVENNHTPSIILTRTQLSSTQRRVASSDRLSAKLGTINKSKSKSTADTSSVLSKPEKRITRSSSTASSTSSSVNNRRATKSAEKHSKQRKPLREDQIRAIRKKILAVERRQKWKMERQLSESSCHSSSSSSSESLPRSISPSSESNSSIMSLSRVTRSIEQLRRLRDEIKSKAKLNQTAANANGTGKRNVQEKAQLNRPSSKTKDEKEEEKDAIEENFTRLKANRPVKQTNIGEVVQEVAQVKAEVICDKMTTVNIEANISKADSSHEEINKTLERFAESLNSSDEHCAVPDLVYCDTVPLAGLITSEFSGAFADETITTASAILNPLSTPSSPSLLSPTSLSSFAQNLSSGHYRSAAAQMLHIPKLMADASTNTVDDDSSSNSSNNVNLDEENETIDDSNHDHPNHQRQTADLSVGTQTMTPSASSDAASEASGDDVPM